MEIIDVEDVITNEDDPSEIIKSKNNCTMAQGLKLLAQGEGMHLFLLETAVHLSWEQRLL